jgi:hypothetical protein
MTFFAALIAVPILSIMLGILGGALFCIMVFVLYCIKTAFPDSWIGNEIKKLGDWVDGK